MKREIKKNKRNLRSEFFREIRKMLKKGGLCGYQKYVRSIIKFLTAGNESYRYDKKRFFSEMISYMREKGYKGAFKELMKNRKSAYFPIKKIRIKKSDLQRVEVKNEVTSCEIKNDNLTDIKEVEEFRDIGEGTLKERMSDLLSCGLKPVSFKEA